MIMLPPIEPLIRRCRALAALDLILSPEWEYRYYSFNSNWSENELMASMRDGSGDEWWAVFHKDGWAALKGLGHASRAWSQHREALSIALQRGFPRELTGFATEPAFRWEATSFAYIHPVVGTGWTRINDIAGYSDDDAGDDELLAHLVRGSSAYAAFASDYYETNIDERVVAEIGRLHPITDVMVQMLNPSTSLKEIADELYGMIGYPTYASN